MASWILNIYSCFLLTGYNINNLQMLIWRSRKISIMPTVRKNLFLLRNILIVGIPKSTVLIIIFRVFMCPLSFGSLVPRSIIHLQFFLNGISKKTRSYYKGMMDNKTPSLSSDSEMASKEKKNRRSMFKIEIKIH